MPIRFSEKLCSNGLKKLTGGPALRGSWSACVLAMLTIVVAPTAARADALPLISYAEQSAGLIRGTSLYDAGAGIRLQAGDIVESRTAGLQIEGLNGTTVALGAGTKIFLVKTGAATELRLLSGWLKVQPPAAAGPAGVAIAADTLRLVGSGTSVIHADTDTIEIFVEQGEDTLSDINPLTKTAQPQPLGRQQYARRRSAQAIELGRPGKEFVAAMPHQFFDPLVSVAARLTAASLPARQREVGYDDISPWLVGIYGLDKKLWTTAFPPACPIPHFVKS